MNAHVIQTEGERLHDQALSFYALGDFTQVEQLLNKAIALEPSNVAFQETRTILLDTSHRPSSHSQRLPGVSGNVQEAQAYKRKDGRDPQKANQPKDNWDNKNSQGPANYRNLQRGSKSPWLSSVNKNTAQYHSDAVADNMFGSGSWQEPVGAVNNPDPPTKNRFDDHKYSNSATGGSFGQTLKQDYEWSEFSDHGITVYNSTIKPSWFQHTNNSLPNEKNKVSSALNHSSHLNSSASQNSVRGSNANSAERTSIKDPLNRVEQSSPQTCQSEETSSEAMNALDSFDDPSLKVQEWLNSNESSGAKIPPGFKHKKNRRKKKKTVAAKKETPPGGSKIAADHKKVDKPTSDYQGKDNKKIERTNSIQVDKQNSPSPNLAKNSTIQPSWFQHTDKPSSVKNSDKPKEPMSGKVADKQFFDPRRIFNSSETTQSFNTSGVTDQTESVNLDSKRIETVDFSSKAKGGQNDHVTTGPMKPSRVKHASENTCQKSSKKMETQTPAKGDEQGSPERGYSDSDERMTEAEWRDIIKRMYMPLGISPDTSPETLSQTESPPKKTGNGVCNNTRLQTNHCTTATNVSSRSKIETSVGKSASSLVNTECLNATREENAQPSSQTYSNVNDILKAGILKTEVPVCRACDTVISNSSPSDSFSGCLGRDTSLTLKSTEQPKCSSRCQESFAKPSKSSTPSQIGSSEDKSNCPGRTKGVSTEPKVLSHSSLSTPTSKAAPKVLSPSSLSTPTSKAELKVLSPSSLSTATSKAATKVLSPSSLSTPTAKAAPTVLSPSSLSTPTSKADLKVLSPSSLSTATSKAATKVLSPSSLSTPTAKAAPKVLSPSSLSTPTSKAAPTVLSPSSLSTPTSKADLKVLSPSSLSTPTSKAATKVLSPLSLSTPTAKAAPKVLSPSSLSTPTAKAAPKVLSPSSLSTPTAKVAPKVLSPSSLSTPTATAEPKVLSLSSLSTPTSKADLKVLSPSSLSTPTSKAESKVLSPSSLSTPTAKVAPKVLSPSSLSTPTSKAAPKVLTPSSLSTPTSKAELKVLSPLSLSTPTFKAAPKVLSPSSLSTPTSEAAPKVLSPSSLSTPTAKATESRLETPLKGHEESKATSTSSINSDQVAQDRKPAKQSAKAFWEPTRIFSVPGKVGENKNTATSVNQSCTKPAVNKTAAKPATKLTIETETCFESSKKDCNAPKRTSEPSIYKEPSIPLYVGGSTQSKDVPQNPNLRCSYTDWKKQSASSRKVDANNQEAAATSQKGSFPSGESANGSKTEQASGFQPHEDPARGTATRQKSSSNNSETLKETTPKPPTRDASDSREAKQSASSSSTSQPLSSRNFISSSAQGSSYSSKYSTSFSRPESDRRQENTSKKTSSQSDEYQKGPSRDETKTKTKVAPERHRKPTETNSAHASQSRSEKQSTNTNSKATGENTRPQPSTGYRTAPQASGSHASSRMRDNDSEYRQRTNQQEDINIEDVDPLYKWMRGIGKHLLWVLGFILLLSLILCACLCSMIKLCIKYGWHILKEIFKLLREHREREGANRGHEGATGGQRSWGPTMGHSGAQPPSQPTRSIEIPTSAGAAIKRLLQCDPDNPFEVLGVSSAATEEDIKKYYRRQCMLVHPDKNDQEHRARKAFQILQKGYETLIDPVKRREFEMESRNVSFSEEMEDFMKKMEEILNTLNCEACHGKHRRYETDRVQHSARYCSVHGERHSANEHDMWAETSYLGLKVHFYAMMEDKIFDITEWAACQRKHGVMGCVEANCCEIRYRLGSNSRTNRGGSRPRSQQSNPPNFCNHHSNHRGQEHEPDISEEQLRDLFERLHRHGAGPPGSDHYNNTNQDRNKRHKKNKKKKR